MRYQRVIYTCKDCDQRVTDVPTGNIIEVKNYICNLCGVPMGVELR